MRSKHAVLSKITKLLSALAVLAVMPVCLATASTPVVRFAVSLDPPQDKSFVVIEPTIEVLRHEFGPKNISIQRYSLPDLENALEGGEVDIFISTSGLSRRMAQNGARDLVTLVSDRLPDPNKAYGTVFITRKDSSIERFADMKGKHLVANMPGGFYGYQIALGEIIKRGYDSQTFFSQTTFVGRDLRSVVNAVLSGQADVGTLSSCFLEDTYEENSSERTLLRVIGERKDSVSACVHSTELYPNWSVSTMPTTSATISKRVTQALLTMPALEGGIAWSPATDFSSTDRLFRELQLGPFGYLREWFLTEFVRTYWQWGVLASIVGLVLCGHSLLMSSLVRRRTKALSEALAREIELKKATEIANEKLQGMNRVLIISQLGTLIAHEIRQPLAAIDAYAHGTMRFLEAGKLDASALSAVMQKIQRQTAKAEEIVDRVRTYAKAKQVSKTTFDLVECFKQTCAVFRKSSRYDAVELKVVISPDQTFPVLASEMELRLALDNLLRNAAESLLASTRAQPLIEVRLERKGNWAYVSVADNGVPLTTADIERMQTPLTSSKPEGLGLGLQIVRTVARSNGGELTLKARAGGGLIAELSFPLEGERW